MEQPRLHYGEKYESDRFVEKRLVLGAQLLVPYLKKGSRVLDIGGYTGDLKKYLLEGVEYWVADFDQAALKVAKGKGARVRKVSLDDETLPFGRAEFDAVVCLEVLEHLKDPRRHLQKISQVVKKDGVVLISLPNENTIYHRLNSLLGFGPDFYAFKLFKHLHLPTIKQSRSLVKEFFKIKSEVYWINVGFKTTRFEFLGRICGLIPDRVWQFLADTWPGLFARGVVFLGRPR